MVQRRIVTGLFSSRKNAEQAVDSILRAGYARDDISVLMADETRRKEFARDTSTRDTGSNAAEGAGVGGAVGGAVGAVLAAIAAVGSNLVIPGLGLVVAGPIAALLAGAGAGAAAGGLIGALIGAGMPEEEARVFDEGLRKGGILLAVEPHADTDVALLARIMENAGAVRVGSRSQGPSGRVVEKV